MGKLNCGNWMIRACGVLLLWAGAAIALPAQTTGIAPAPILTTLHTFEATDGDGPNAALVQSTDGNLYGTTAYGGAHGEGTVFKITPSGTLTTVYDFCSQSNCTDGANLYSVGLVQAINGDLYGITVEGGASSGNLSLCGGVGCGTVFKIAPSGKLTTLYNFCSQGGSDCTDGSEPLGGLVQAPNGDLYGTTIGGGYDGTEACHSYSGCGTVFKITPSGTLTTLHRFDYTDGANPGAALVQAKNGDLYGTTRNGGANGSYIGTIFKIAPSGALTTLYTFCSKSLCADGAFPNGLVQATDGKFYGTTERRGLNGCDQGNGCGTVFTIAPSGNLTTLYTFGQGGHGNEPYAGLIQATDGNFYGTTSFGGTNDACPMDVCLGTLFKITSGGKLTTLYDFCSQGGYDCTDGAFPQAALAQDTNGKFYGTTSEGGETNMALSSAFPWVWGRLWKHSRCPARWERRSRSWGPI